MKPITPNQRASKAISAMRSTRDSGATDAEIIAAGELAAGGDAEAVRIAAKVWANKFLVMGAV